MNVRKLSFEFFGTATLLIAVVGSSFMASYLKADWALGLLINASVTAAVLAIIIKVGAPISGAHFNPVVSLTSWLLKKSTFGQFISYSVAQVVGAVIGVLIANAMFSSDFIGSSSMQRSGTGLFIGEIVATIGLVYLALSSNEKSAWKLIPLWIFAVGLARHHVHGLTPDLGGRCVDHATPIGHASDGAVRVGMLGGRGSTGSPVR